MSCDDPGQIPAPNVPHFNHFIASHSNIYQVFTIHWMKIFTTIIVFDRIFLTFSPYFEWHCHHGANSVKSERCSSNWTLAISDSYSWFNFSCYWCSSINQTLTASRIRSFEVIQTTITVDQIIMVLLSDLFGDDLQLNSPYKSIETTIKLTSQNRVDRNCFTVSGPDCCCNCLDYLRRYEYKVNCTYFR